MENSEAPRQNFRYLKPLIYLFTALFLFLNLAEDIVEKERLSIDLPIQLFLHSYETPTLDSVVLVLTQAGSANALVPLNILRPLHEVASDGRTRQKSLKKRSLHRVNEHFLMIFNAVIPSIVFVQRSQ
jgi:hypothetical protein